MLNLLCLWSINKWNKAWMTEQLFITLFTKYFKPTVVTPTQKRTAFKILTLTAQEFPSGPVVRTLGFHW